MHNETEPLDVSKSEISIVCRGVPKLLRGTYVIETSSHKANHFASLILRLPITKKVTGFFKKVFIRNLVTYRRNFNLDYKVDITNMLQAS